MVKKRSSGVREAHDALLTGLSIIEKGLESATLERQVEIGSILWELGDHVRAVLDKIKSTVREKASQRTKGLPGTVVLKGEDLGEVLVTIPEANLQVPKGTNMEDLKRILGVDFGLFFEESVSFRPRKEFEDRATKVQNPLHQQVLHGAVTRVEGTPRVSFKRRLPVE